MGPIEHHLAMEQEDTKVLLDESHHNQRHLRSESCKSSSWPQWAGAFIRRLTTTRWSADSQRVCCSWQTTTNQQHHRPLFVVVFWCATITLILATFTLLHMISNNRKQPAPNRAPLDGHYSRIKVPEMIQYDSVTWPPMQYNRHNKWIVSSSKCHIPNLDPWHKDTSDYCRVKRPLNCSEYSNDRALTFVANNKLYFFGQTPPEEPNQLDDCCYSHIERLHDDSNLRVNKECHPIKANGTMVPYDHVVVKCQRANYTNVHSFIHGDPEQERQLDRVASEKLDESHYYNLVFIGIDTMSRLNMYRQMPKTLKVLRGQYQMIELRGYNKVGENTFPNLVPLLSGMSPEQLITSGCWNTTYKDESGDDYFDKCQFLWDHYARRGYRTLFNEDWPAFSTFNYLKPGFKRQPTHYYGRPWHLYAKKFGHSHTDNQCYPCVHNQPAIEIYLNYIKHFLQHYKHKPHFAFQWLNCPQHDDLNGASTFDHYFSRFFHQLHQQQLVQDRTILVVFSDHGYRWGKYLDTVIGHQEASLPFMALSLPRLLKSRHPELVKNLAEHSDKLVTPFDVYRTILDVLALSVKHGLVSAQAAPTPNQQLDQPLEPFHYDQQLLGALPINRANNFSTVSMLRGCLEATRDRGCDEAGIPDNYCVCNKFEQVAVNGSQVLASAWFLVRHINEKLAPERAKCVQLSLDSILGAKQFKFSTRANGSSLAGQPKVEYEIKITTVPGYGIFEEVVRLYGDLDKCSQLVDQVTSGGATGDRNPVAAMSNLQKAHTSKLVEVCKFAIHSQSISRLNIYGTQSECLTHSDAELRKMCYCKDQPMITTTMAS